MLQSSENQFSEPETVKSRPFLTKQYKLSIGVVIFSLSTTSDLDLTIPEPYEAFLVSGGKPKIFLTSQFGTIPSVQLDEKLFQTNGMWSLYKSNNRLAFHFQSPEIEDTPHRLAIIEPGYDSGIIYTRILDSGRDW